MARALVMLQVALLMLAPAGSRAEELVSLTTRENVTQSYLLAYNKGETYRAVAILFAGGAGHIGLKQSADGVSVSSHNFLVRSRDKFVSGGVAAAVIDGPSDYSRMTDAFRMSSMHSADVAAIITDLKKDSPTPKSISSARVAAQCPRPIPGWRLATRSAVWFSRLRYSTPAEPAAAFPASIFRESRFRYCLRTIAKMPATYVPTPAHSAFPASFRSFP
ncbi:MAG: hypothetical protein EXR29_05240 [Betaproteobacteria bacterium]|nr:hypothetical protein [Betaproteobacteria bacterium]